jgi:hypothetical protein
MKFGNLIYVLECSKRYNIMVEGIILMRNNGGTHASYTLEAGTAGKLAAAANVAVVVISDSCGPLDDTPQNKNVTLYHRTEESIAQHLYRLKMRDQITDYVQACPTCQKNKRRVNNYVSTKGTS